MWRDLCWGLAALAALALAGITIIYGLRTMADLEGNDKKKLSETSPELFNGSDSEYGQLETDSQHARTQYPDLSLATRLPDKPEAPGPQDDEYDEPTEEPEASSPYLFQPIRYMNIPKDKRSVYREYKDESDDVAKSRMFQLNPVDLKRKFGPVRIIL